jgi:hypothetical protein
LIALSSSLSVPENRYENPGGFVPEWPGVRGDIDREHPVYAAGVEVVHRRLAIDDPDDRDRIGNLWMVEVRDKASPRR